MALTPLIGPTELAFAIALPAVLLAGWFGGRGPGALCVLISGAAHAYYFTEPVGSFLVNNQTDQISFVIFLVLGFGIVFLGDSQRRAVERALRSENAERSERQRFETTLRSIGDAVVATDADGRVTFANRVALSLLRWPEIELPGRPLAEVFRIVNEETRATVESPVARVLREGGIVGLANHTVLIARDGTETPIDDSAAPLLGSDGKMQGAVLVFRDITERRHAEAASRLLASIVESSGDAIFSQDLNGVVTTWNIGAERIFGYTAEEMIGKPASVLAAPQFPDEMATDSGKGGARRARGPVSHHPPHKIWRPDPRLGDRFTPAECRGADYGRLQNHPRYHRSGRGAKGSCGAARTFAGHLEQHRRRGPFY